MSRHLLAGHEFRQEIPASLAAVENFCLAVRRWVLSVQLPNRFAVELLTREALTNAAVHGCRADSSKHVSCVLRMRPGRVIIAVRDQGRGFDWRAALTRTPAVDTRSGRGIAIIRQYASRLRFNQRGNSLIMIKAFDMKRYSMSEPSIAWEEGKTVIRPAGDVVGASVPELRSVLQTTITNGARDVVLDLCNTEMVDSSGLGLVIGTYNSLQKVGGRLTVIHASPDVQQLFQTMRMNQHFAIFGD